MVGFFFSLSFFLLQEHIKYMDLSYSLINISMFIRFPRSTIAIFVHLQRARLDGYTQYPPSSPHSNPIRNVRRVCRRLFLRRFAPDPYITWGEKRERKKTTILHVMKSQKKKFMQQHQGAHDSEKHKPTISRRLTRWYYTGCWSPPSHAAARMDMSSLGTCCRKLGRSSTCPPRDRQ